MTDEFALVNAAVGISKGPASRRQTTVIMLKNVETVFSCRNFKKIFKILNF